MSMEEWINLLAWSLLINYTILLVWVVVFIFFKDWIRSLHGRWFDIPAQQFDVIHYMLMGIYKLLILLFNLVPYLVLRFIV